MSKPARFPALEVRARPAIWPLFDFDAACGLALLLNREFGDADGEYAVGHRSVDVFAVCTIGERKTLFELAVGEFATEVFLLLALLGGIAGLLLHGDDERVVGGKGNCEVILCHARSGHFHLVAFGVFRNVDGRRSAEHGGTPHIVVVEKFAEERGKPAILATGINGRNQHNG